MLSENLLKIIALQKLIQPINKMEELTVLPVFDEVKMLDLEYEAVRNSLIVKCFTKVWIFLNKWWVNKWHYEWRQGKIW